MKSSRVPVFCTVKFWSTGLLAEELPNLSLTPRRAALFPALLGPTTSSMSLGERGTSVPSLNVSWLIKTRGIAGEVTGCSIVGPPQV